MFAYPESAAGFI